MKSILFALPTPRLSGELTSFVYQFAGQVATYDAVADSLMRTKPDALVIGDNLPQVDDLDLEQTIRGARNIMPELEVVIIATRSSAHAELITHDLANVYLVQEGDNVGEQVARVLDLRGGKSNRTFEFANWSPKGGVGKTTLNIATSQALVRMRPGTRVLLWDLDLYDADVADGFDIKVGTNDLASLLESKDFSPQAVEKVIYQHAESGVHVLAAPESPIDARHYPLTPAAFQSIRESILQLGYEFVIYDLPVSVFLWKPAIEALRSCDAIFLVMTPDRFPIKAVQRILPVFENENFFPRTKFVINKARAAGIYKLDAATLKQHFFGIETIASVHPDQLVGDAQQSQKTLWQLDKESHSVAAKDLEQYALRILELAGRSPSEGEANSKRPKRSLWGR